jgi:redox-sensitive bicupin YhaK (pirin superfamily)
MIKIRKSEERGHANHGWLDTYHTFSFADYYDPEYMGFQDLRVINDDKVAGGSGFGMHPHRDMEIITYVLSGELEHRDSMGNGEVIHPGEVQCMTAGTGVKHSEFNHSPDKSVHLLQIWIMPERKGLPPGYAQKSFADVLQPGKLKLAVSHSGRDGSLKINQDVDLSIGKFNGGEKVSYALRPNRHAWVQVATGNISLNGQELKAGDGAAISDETTLTLSANGPAQALVFDLN